jgi:hypothetical protein
MTAKLITRTATREKISDPIGDAAPAICIFTMVKVIYRMIPSAGMFLRRCLRIQERLLKLCWRKALMVMMMMMMRCDAIARLPEPCREKAIQAAPALSCPRSVCEVCIF